MFSEMKDYCIKYNGEVDYAHQNSLRCQKFSLWLKNQSPGKEITEN